MGRGEPEDETVAARRARPDAETQDDGPPPSGVGPVPVPTSVPVPPGYRLHRPLGAGGMGAVYLVEHVASGARRALKVLLDDGDVDRRGRFRRELEALVAVDGHPNVVRVHAGGEGPRAAWLLLSLAEGGDLEERLARGPLPPAEVLRLGQALARGLAHIHARGVLHRDLKPGNILFDASGTPLLVDFGLAWLEGATRLTATGSLLGTPLYLAPEQARAAHGRSGDDPRIDVWGLGAVLYHCATGRPPFLAEGLAPLVAAIQLEAPRPPRQLAPDLSPALEAVILRCLEKEPARRFPGAAALVDALAAAAADPAGGAGGWRLSLVLGGLAVLALAASAALFAGTPAPAPDPRPGAGPAPAAATPVERALAGVEAALAAEDGDAALALLGPLPAGAPGRDAWRLAALALASERARATYEATADGPGREAVRAARALAGGGGPAPGEALRGSSQLLRRRAALRAAAAEWERDEVAPDVASLVGPSAGREAAREVSAAALGPAVTALVDAAALWPERGPERALRVLAQRALLEVDAGLVVAALDRDLARASRLADGPAAGALERVRRWSLARRPRDDDGCGARDLGPPLPPLAPDGPYAPQALVGLALDVVGARHDADALDAGLRAWDALERGAAAAGWGPLAGELPRRPAAAERAALLADAAAARSSLLAWRAWYARGTPAFAERLEAARQAAEALPPSGSAAAAYHVARARLLAGETELLPAALERVPAHLRAARSDAVFALEAALLRGDLPGARRIDVDLLVVTGARGLGRVAWLLGQAELEALDDHAGAAAGHLEEARRALAVDPGQAVFLPWRTPAETERILAAIRGGWRPWVARRPAPD